ncbi:type II toxin-antitoxin system VapC family toxin [Ferrovibrio sp.]|uniref:type II toxin-antitoxin system VapC family toxin n=1 Tax=Ferrovibrio sp. TaxID=1917215 RepID=UPI003D0A1004
MILLDTHVLIWLLYRSRNFGPRTQALLDQGFQAESLVASAISYWEIGLLQRKRRIELDLTASEFRDTALKLGIDELPLDGATAIAAASLDLHPDPADRFILATAQAQAAILVTADEQLLAWPGQVNRQDARL